MNPDITIEMSDSVDWEPLRMRFVPEAPTTDAVVTQVTARVSAWFKAVQANGNEDVPISYWNVRAGENGVIEAKCEFISEDGVRRLAEHIAASHPQYRRVVLGHDMPDTHSSNDIVWEEIPPSDVEVDGNLVHVNACRISLAHVTIDQYIAFLDTTGYVPEFDRSGEYDFRGSQISSGGRKAGQWPVTQITLADAVAYADWIGCRLPSEVELYASYRWKRQQKKNYVFGTECWTSTRTEDGKVIVLQQPFINRPLPPIQELRSPQPPGNNSYPFMSFRVVKEAAG